MKAESLRIGNQIRNIRGDVDDVCVQTMIFLTNYPGEHVRLSPVILDDQMLLKMGFQKQPLYESQYFLKIGKTDLFYVRPCFMGGYYWGFNQSFELNEPVVITHLHELQNIVFALSGIELRLNK